ncbi:MAG: endo-1,4-beta-xylanase [Treponema sp.]|jgi:endo-1,4-beta-xylanase|nr:endo-1,4-beta-xylanase [Treponema sp.]
MKKKFLIMVALLAIIPLFIGCPPDKDEDIVHYEYNDTTILSSKWPFPVGAAVPGAGTNNGGPVADNNALSQSSRQHQFLKHFNVLVAENEMKPEAILPANRPSGDPSEWTAADFRFTNAKALADYAKNNGKKMRFHTLIWHDQTPAWFFRNPGGTAQASKAELYEHMEHFIRVVFEWVEYNGYNDTILWWDVVNEAVAHDTKGARPPTGDGRSLYTAIMRAAGGTNDYEFIVKAFQWARQYADENNCTNAKLYLTDFGVERPFFRGSEPQTSKQADFKALVEYLIAQGAPIDGVGFQGHFRMYDHPVNQISEGIDMFAALTRNSTNLKVQICELDFSIYSNAKGEGQAKTISTTNLLNTRLNDLADTYRSFFNMFEQKFDDGKLDMVIIWGIADGHSWLNNHPVSGRTDYPLLFSRNYKGKEAYNKLVTNRGNFSNHFGE